MKTHQKHGKYIFPEKKSVNIFISFVTITFLEIKEQNIKIEMIILTKFKSSLSFFCLVFLSFKKNSNILSRKKNCKKFLYAQVNLSLIFFLMLSMYLLSRD